MEILDAEWQLKQKREVVAELQGAQKVILELSEVLREVRDFWAGGDCPAELMEKIEVALTRAAA